MVDDLYLLLKRQADFSVKEIEKVLGEELTIQTRSKIPIFLAEDRLIEITSVSHLIKCLDTTEDYLHMTHSQSMALMKTISVKCTARSERTGDFINFTSRRFRYTKGTNLARRGITGVSLAFALDHSDIQNIDVYTENTEEMAEQIDAVMSSALAPLAQAFAGKLIQSERDALRANDPHSRVKTGSAMEVGNCGTFAFCASGHRICYTCVNFEPWADAPHEEVLEEVLNERRRQSEEGISSNVISSTDRLLLAVQQVIHLCQKAKLERLRGAEDV